GETVDVDMFVHTQISPQGYLPRKFKSTNRSFSEVLGATLSRETIGDGAALKLSYSITDGGVYDDDGTANGVIVDPVGLAVAHTGTSSPGELAKTGLSVTLLTFLGGGIIAAVTYTYLDYRKHKKPLLQS